MLQQLDHAASAVRPPWPARMKIVVLLVSLTVCFDGFDSLLLPPSLSAIGAEWHLRPGAFSLIFALTTVGYTIGSTIAGFVSDRFGRRLTLIASIVLVGIASLLTARCTGLLPLAAVRMVTGAAVGGIVTAAFTAVPEFTPPRLRGIVIAAMTLCEPIGGVFAGLLCAALLVQHGWRVLFIAGGVVPLVYALALLFMLPDTPAFLSSHPRFQQKRKVLLQRFGLAETDPLAQPPEKRDGGGMAALFSPVYRRDTILLWISGFFWLLFLFMILNWLPSLLTLSGAPPRIAIASLTLFTLGSAVGALTSIFLVRPFGTRRCLIVIGCCQFAVLSLLCVAFAAKTNVSLLLGLIAASGFFCAAGQCFMIVLIPHLYGTRHRGVGVGFALGVGRLGTIAAAFLGPFALRHGGGMFFEYEFAIGLIAIFCAASVGNQLSPAPRGASPAGSPA